MKITESKTYIATPPGATIQEIIENRGITSSQFAAQLGESEDFVQALIDGDVELTQTLAQRIEKDADIPADFLLNLERFYREDLANVIAENAQEEERKAKKASRKAKADKRKTTIAVQPVLAVSS